MIDAVQFDQLIAALLKAGVPTDRANRFAALIGDTPELDGDQIIVREEDGTEVGRVPASALE